jgi:hypothetical protein
MRIVRLADLFEQKYSYGSVVKTAASPAEVLAQAKDEILTNYKNWVMGKYRALVILAEANEPHAKALYGTYNDLVANIDSYSPVQIFNRVNKILSLIKEMKTSPKGYRESIHDMVQVNKESDRNYREQLKSGFETNLMRISYGLEKVAKVLRDFVPETQLGGGAVEPQRKDLSKEKLLMFMRTPAAQYYGLDNIEVMTHALSYPEVKEKITTLVNSIDRGHTPADGPEVMAEARAIKSWLDNKKTNLPALEQTPEKPASPVSLFEEEEDQK